MFSSNTLYYFFSTLAQMIAAIVALIAVLVHFRISALRDFLVGDGEAVLKRKERREEGYNLLPVIHKNRLIDAIERKDITGIKKVIKLLACNEKKEGHTLEDRPRGFQRLFKYYEKTENQINEMSRISKMAFFFAAITACYSTVAILLIDYAINCFWFQIILVGMNLILLSICGYFISKGIRLAFKNFTNRFD